MRHPNLNPLRKQGRLNAPLNLLLFVSAVLFTTTAAFSQQLIKDINRNENPNVNEYDEAIDLNGTLYFTSAGELWKTNGTKETSSRIKKFNSINFLTRSGNILYFNASDATGDELWKSDGTTAGTVKVKDIRPGEIGSGPRLLTMAGSTLFFIANDGVHGSELWKSDGTSSGTSLVRNIASGSSNPSFLTNVNGTLFFVANNGTQGYELWKSNGTAAGTSLVKDIKTETRKSSSPRLLTNVNGVLYFTAEDDETGRELWKSDGTTMGTRLVKDILPGVATSFVKNLVDINNILFFSANDGVHGHELWKSDGTSSGTMMIKDMTPGSPGSDTRAFWPEKMSNFTNVDGKLYFTAFDANVYSYWKSDGTPGGTKAIFPMEMELWLAPSILPQFTKLNSSVYFNFPTNRNYPISYMDLMKEDALGKVTRISSLALWDYYDSRNQLLVKSGHYLYMTGRRTINSGYALFKSDGVSSAALVIDAYSLKDQSSYPEQFVNFGTNLYFVATLGLSEPGKGGYGLLKTNGTSSGTSKIFESEAIGIIGNIGGSLYFTTYQDDHLELYKSDGTSQGTVNLQVSPPTSEYNTITYVNSIGSKRFTVWSSYQYLPVYLWVDDGVSSKQLAVFDAARDFHVAGNYLFFVAENSTSGSELWRSDGTVAGTRMVKDIYPGAKGSSPGSLADYKGLLYFTANDGVNGFEMWRSNGMASGTLMLKNLSSTNSTNGSGGVQHFQTVNGLLYFTSTEKATTTLWKTTGTSSGTVMINEIPTPRRLLDGGNQLLIITETNGQITLWKSNGTPETTNFIADLPQFYFSDGALKTMAINGVVYFSNGQDLWRSDGTPCGTFIVPLTMVASPLSYLGNEIIFAATDPVIGTELFKINTADIVVDCASSMAAASTPIVTDEGTITNYPNPFTSYFELRLSGTEGGNYNVAIYNISGQIVESHQYKYNGTYLLGSQWPAGLYLMKIIHDGRSDITRLVKQR